jgi:hypothetical protein
MRIRRRSWLLDSLPRANSAAWSSVVSTFDPDVAACTSLSTLSDLGVQLASSTSPDLLCAPPPAADAAPCLLPLLVVRPVCLLALRSSSRTRRAAPGSAARGEPSTTSAPPRRGAAAAATVGTPAGVDSRLGLNSKVCLSLAQRLLTIVALLTSELCSHGSESDFQSLQADTKIVGAHATGDRRKSHSDWRYTSVMCP